MLSIFVLMVCSLLNENFVHSEATSCTESHKLFADLCFPPTPADNIDYSWILANQPADGWYSELGNDILLLHDSELLKGEILTTVDEETEKTICLRSKTERTGDDSRDGEVFGFGDKHFNFTCKNSLDFPKVQKCSLNSGLGAYHEKSAFYISYSDNKNVYVVIVCYGTGEVGWRTNSPMSKLTEEEKMLVYNHVESLGFPKTTTVTLYNDNCGKN